jgi:hypothetical protein
VHAARTERRRARRFARQAVLALAVLLPEGLPREVSLPEAVPMVIPAAQPGPVMALRQEQAAVARPAVPAGSHRGLEMPARHPARPSAAVARKAQAQQSAARRPVEPGVVRRQVVLRLAEPAVQAGVTEAAPQQEVQPASAAQPQAARAELAVSDAGALQPGEGAAAGLQPAAGSAAAVRQPEEAAVLDAAEAALPQAAVRAAVVARLRVAQAAGPVAEEALRRGAQAGVRRRAAGVAAPDEAGVRRRVVQAAGVPRRAARDAAPGVLLLAAAWAALPWTRFRGDRRGDRLAPSARARSAHARGRLRTAQP